MCFRFGFIDDCLLDGCINGPPECRDIRIGLTPCIDQWLEFGFIKAHLQSPHGLQSTNGAAVSKREFCNFPFLTEVGILTMFFDWYFEHFAGAFAVDILAVFKDIHTPLFPGEEGQDSGFNGREITDDVFVPGLWHKCRADQFGEDTRHIVIEQFQGIEISVKHQVPGFFQILQVVLRQVLQLNAATSPSTGTAGTIEHEASPGAVVRAHPVGHGGVFADRGLCQLLAAGEDICHILADFRQQTFYRLFIQGCCFDSFGR